MGALGLVTNAVVLWNTIYMQAALDHLRAQGETLNDEDIARLSPLCHGHINGRPDCTVPPQASTACPAAKMVRWKTALYIPALKDGALRRT